MSRLITYFILCASFFTSSSAQNVPIEKFVGIWNPIDKNCSSATMKISQEEGRIIVQVKNLVQGEAILNGNRLEVSVVDEVKYGKYWVGPWGGWYASDGEWVPRSENNILVGHNDGGHGTNGPVAGFFSERYRYSKANKEIKYLSVHIVYKYEGALELYFTFHIAYYNGDTPLFYQSSADEMYRYGKPIVYRTR